MCQSGKAGVISMEEKKRVLFLSEEIGAGHNKAAEALNKALCSLDSQITTVRLDTFKYVNRLLNKIIVETYLEILKFTPQIYGFLYAKAATSEEGKTAEFKRIISSLVATRLQSFIREFNPNAIVCTHPFPCGIMSIMKEKGKISVPIIGVVTDFTVHPFWVYDNIDMYIVASEKLKYDLIVKGIDDCKILSTGIPIDLSFAETVGNKNILLQFGLNPAVPTFLVMGGGLGIGPFEEIISALGNIKENLQLLVITGNNVQRREKLQNIAKGCRNKVVVLGYVECIAQVMEACTAIITKPGGLTSAEALAKALPMIIFGSIPGQEVKNTEFLLHTEAAFKVGNPKSLVRVVEFLLRNSNQLERMRQACWRYSKPKAAIEGAEAIYRML
jgi:processive 1,2-diacylglycerol beta-glucosyltransferase